MFLLLFIFSFPGMGLSLKPNDLVLPEKVESFSKEKLESTFKQLEEAHSESTPTLWRLKFQKSLLLKKQDPAAFCEGMGELAKTPSFPLHQLSLIYFYESCLDISDPSPVFDPEAFPEWLRIRLAKSFYQRGKKFNNKDYILLSSQYLGEHAPYKDLRISYLKHALSLAKQENKVPTFEQIQELLYKEAPYLNPIPEEKDYLSVAHGYRKNRAFQRARFYYRKIIESPEATFEDKNQSFRWLHWTYKARKNYKQQVKTSKAWSDWLFQTNSQESLEYYYNNEMNLVRDYWNYDKNEKALEELDKIMKDPKASVITDRAYWLRGLINEQEKNFDESLRDWSKSISSLKRKKDKEELLEQVLWKKAWVLKNQKKYTQSLRILHEIKSMTSNPYLRYKIVFWIGEIYRNLNFKLLANKTFKQLTEEDVFGYYGLMAHHRLNQELNIRIKETDFQKYKDVIHYDSENIVYWLFIFNETELLKNFLNLKKDKLLTQKIKSKEDWMNLLYLYKLSKNYLASFKSIEKMQPKIKHFFLENHLDLLFPLEYRKDIEVHAQKQQIPRALVYALIRQESVFNKRARSPADAFGLMQLIPSTARQVSRQLQVHYRGFRQLYNPTRNILLGTAHLKTLLDQYDNSFILATAAYNAGSSPVDQWRKYIVYETPLEFIENIPYEETRTYVRLLIRNYIFYHNLLKDQDADYPEWIFKMKPLEDPIKTAH
ncbi:MAG: transglycosylase SLT domain-containing protein [Bdellovibrionales bacterium]